MFEFINKWRKSRRSFWVLLITDGYLMGYHATGKRERSITSGCTFDGLNYLEWMDSMEPGLCASSGCASILSKDL